MMIISQLLRDMFSDGFGFSLSFTFWQIYIGVSGLNLLDAESLANH